ncbi:MAG: hypothetical protein ACRCYX_11095 [Dermatophilaceae bacterium]
MNASLRVACGGDELGEYVAGTLPVDREWLWARHLVACQLCAQAAAEERKMRSALAGAPLIPGELQASLLALGRSLAAESPARAGGVDQDPLRLLAPSAPPCYRSPLRATMLAAAAAGLSAATAWSLTTASAAPTGSVVTTVTTVTTTPVGVLPGRVASPGEPVVFHTPARSVTSPQGSWLPGLGAESAP